MHRAPSVLRSIGATDKTCEAERERKRRREEMVCGEAIAAYHDPTTTQHCKMGFIHRKRLRGQSPERDMQGSRLSLLPRRTLPLTQLQAGERRDMCVEADAQARKREVQERGWEFAWRPRKP